MRPFRSRLLLRTVAALLVAGVGTTLAPAAVARDAREDALRSLLNDEEAFEAALDAARRTAEGADPRAVFVDAYVAATDGQVAAEVVEYLLDGESLGLVAPALPDDAFVPTPTPTSPPPSGGAAILSPTPDAGALAVAETARPGGPVRVQCVEGRSLQPRAP